MGRQPSRRTPRAPTVKTIHPLEWIFEPLYDHPDFARKKMFGCEVAMLRGLTSLVLAAGEEPWNGLLVSTSREFHASLMADFPELAPHSILGKWLYISQTHEHFEEVAARVRDLSAGGDLRIGVESKPRKSSKYDKDSGHARRTSKPRTHRRNSRRNSHR